jgi:hypothetical protein
MELFQLLYDAVNEGDGSFLAVCDSKVNWDLGLSEAGNAN